MAFWKRRAVLGGLLALPAVRRAIADGGVAMDVVIVGAGAAGIAAARDLAAKRLRVVVLEARGRIGGRAVTDATTLGQPFDLGAHWLHSADVNPLVEAARAMGLGLTASDPTGVRLFDRATEAPEADHDAFRRAAARLERRAFLPAMIGPDRALSELVSGKDPWELAAMAAPKIEMGAEADEISLHDYSALATGDDLVVQGGYGGLVAALGTGIDVRLNAAVTAIHWQADGGVRVEGAFGAVRARAVIVTVPTAILAAGTIRFTPELPQEVQTAFADLPMCAFEKVGFLLDRALPGLPEYAVVPRLLAEGRTHALHLSPDRRVATVIMAADTARALAAEGPTAMIAFGQEVLTQVIGSDVRVDGSLATHWLGDPLARGAYSHARIGRAGARTIYDGALADRLWFAGEAAAGPLAVTVAGAWTSGLRAAREAARRLAA